MNTYHIKQVDFDDKGKIPNNAEIQARHPRQAYENYLLTIEGMFSTIQEDDIGTSDNPCVRFISVDNRSNKKFLFYVKRQF